jgi:2-C-methyl-D-erythritol 4-phosphate cytidylyltransferase
VSRALWALIPAAGIGSRFGADIPKQYCEINGQTILDISIAKMLAVPNLQGLVLALAANDSFWPKSIHYQNPKIHIVDGGAERADSVLNGLRFLKTYAAQKNINDDVWVLVHDAARPCVQLASIKRLIETAAQDEHGAMLAVPVADTLKRSGVSTSRIDATVSRENIWRGNTPQFFGLSTLNQAIADALAAGVLVTDEASAMEHAGYQPHLVVDSPTNIKVTLADDLALAELYLTFFAAQASD